MILREDDDEGKPLTYWVAHGTQLLRCAPHHVRGDFRHGAAAETAIGGLEEARRSVASLKSRGVTRFMDLNRLNKRTLDDVDTDEEGMDDDDTPDGGPPLQRPRLDLPSPEPPLEPNELAEVEEVSPVPTTPAHSPTGTVIPVPDDDPGLLAEPATLELDGGNLPITAVRKHPFRMRQSPTVSHLFHLQFEIARGLHLRFQLWIPPQRPCI